MEMKKQEGKIKKRVIVAMSGGIDSTVAAALLKRADFDVMGIFMRTWKGTKEEFSHHAKNKHYFLDEERRAEKAAKILNIPFYVFDIRKEFKKSVVDYFIRECKKNRTPNPCVICNKEIKFGVLLKKILSLNADYLATGHYAKLKKTEEGYHLFRSKDRDKDQSYFLWTLGQNQLKKVLFPLGDYKKKEIRELAKKFKLPVNNIPESQEICFIPNTIYDFLKKYINLKKGKIITDKGEILGVHNGLPLYTIGQRRGIGQSGGPYYVLEKNIKDNLLIVTKDEKKIFKKDIFLEKVNWIFGHPPKLPIEVKAKVRYRQKEANAILSFSHKKYFLRFKKPQRAITPGQSAVFFVGEEIIGGGIIV